MGIPVPDVSTQILDEPEFDAQGDWILGNDWTIAGSQLTYQFAGGGQPFGTHQPLVLTQNDLYVVKFEVTEFNMAGGNNLVVFINGLVKPSSFINAPGEYILNLPVGSIPNQGVQLAHSSFPVGGDKIVLEFCELYWGPDFIAVEMGIASDTPVVYNVIFQDAHGITLRFVVQPGGTIQYVHLHF